MSFQHCRRAYFLLGPVDSLSLFALLPRRSASKELPTLPLQGVSSTPPVYITSQEVIATMRGMSMNDVGNVFFSLSLAIAPATESGDGQQTLLNELHRNNKTLQNLIAA